LPLGGLLQIALNAILHASPASEKVSAEPTARVDRDGATLCSPDDVSGLPGLIPISQTRQLERLDHVPSGRMLMTRFMVRGYWRRPVTSWKDQHMRWNQLTERF
jgi:hypothetical protein